MCSAAHREIIDIRKRFFKVSEMGFRPLIGIFGVSEMGFRPPIYIFGMSEMDFINLNKI